MKVKRIALLIGSLFVAVVSVLSACRIEDRIWQVLLIVSAFVSLFLAIIKLIDSRKTAEEIAKLKQNQLDVRIEGETVVFIKGEGNK